MLVALAAASKGERTVDYQRLLERQLERQNYSASLVAEALHTTQAEIADALGVSHAALLFGRTRAQQRLREMLEIIRRLEPLGGTQAAAYRWFRSAPLAGFNGRTPDQLVRAGEARHVHAYLDHVLAGGYA